MVIRYLPKDVFVPRNPDLVATFRDADRFHFAFVRRPTEFRPVTQPFQPVYSLLSARDHVDRTSGNRICNLSFQCIGVLNIVARFRLFFPLSSLALSCRVGLCQLGAYRASAAEIGMYAMEQGNSENSRLDVPPICQLIRTARVRA